MIHDTQHSRAPRIYPIFPLSDGSRATDQRGIGMEDRTRDHWHHVDRLPITFTAPRRSARPWSTRWLLILPSIRSSARTPRNASIRDSCTTLIRRPTHRDSRLAMITDHRSHAPKTHRSVPSPVPPLLVQHRDPDWEKLPLTRARRNLAAESGPRIRSRRRANSGEKNILGSRHATNKEARDDNLLIKLTAVSRRARGTRLPWDNLPIARNRSGQRLNSGRTIPNFLHYHLSYISTEDTVPPLNRYITRHVTLKREKKRRRRRGRRRRKRESIDVVIVAPVHSARNTNNWHLVATFWHNDSTISLSANVWRGRRQVGGGDGGRWQARPNITRRWWR